MKTIVVVEDNPDNLMLACALLEPHFAVVTYEDGASAVAGLKASKPDLVLMDISLPGMDGMATLKLVRAEHSMTELPVIALTAHAMKGDRERYLGAGFNDYVAKPILEPAVLLAAIQRCLPISAPSG